MVDVRADDRARSFTPFQRGTVIALGLLVFAVMYALMRSRAEAHRDRLVVVNGYKRREFEWAEIIAVHLPPGAPWVTLDLADGEHRAGDGRSRAPTATGPGAPSETLRALVARVVT